MTEQHVATLAPVVRQAHDHQRLAWMNETQLGVILDGAVTGGRLMVVEVIAQRGDAAPEHVHSQEDEAFIVLSGGMTVWVGDQRHHLEPGAVGFLPRHLPHAYRFTEDNTHALNICTPSGLEDFFREAGWDLSRPRPADWKVDLGVMAAASGRRGITIVGPPRS